MANDQLVLQINKLNLSPESNRLRYNQSERGKAVDVTVIDTDGVSPYDLSGKKITFVDLKEGQKIIVDAQVDESDSTGKFIRTDANDRLGKFTYVFQEKVYQRSGIADFEFKTDDKHIDVTAKFEIEIEATAHLAPDNSNYISSMASMEDHLNSAINQAQQAITSITSATDDTKKYALDTLNNLKSQYQDYKKQFDQMTTDWTTQRQTIQKSADDQIAKIKDLDKQAVDEAVKSITTKRDQELKKADDSLANKLQALQTDYENWKKKTVDDFAQQMKDNTDNVNAVREQMKTVSDKMDQVSKQFSSVDFTNFAKLSDVYTKKQVDDLIATAGKMKQISVNGGVPVGPNSNGVANITIPQPDLSGLAPKSDVSALQSKVQTDEKTLAGKANASDVYTKQESDNKYYVRADVDTKLNEKISSITVNGGVPVHGDANHNINISIPKPDLSNYVTQDDLKKLTVGVDITEAEYNKLPQAQRDNPLIIYKVH